MGIIEAISAALKLVVLVLGEIFAARKRAREAQEKYELNREAFLAAAQKALTDMREAARRESGQARDVEDQVDEELRKK